MMVYICILNWKSAEDTINCLNSVMNLESVDFKVIIIDNASPDDSFCVIADHIENNFVDNDLRFKKYTHDCVTEGEILNTCDKIVLLQSKSNIGYSGGNNIGINFALQQNDCEYVWVLNNDTEVDKESLSFLLDRCNKDSQIGICGSRLVYFSERQYIQGLGGKFNKWLCTTRHYKAYDKSDTIYDDCNISNEIDYIIGASMLIKKVLLDEIGSLDENYFLYFEELDICLRAKKNGYRLGVSTESIVYHKEGASFNKETSLFGEYHMLISKRKFINKFYPRYKFFMYANFLLMFCNRVRRREFRKAIQIVNVGFLRKYDR